MKECEGDLVQTSTFLTTVVSTLAIMLPDGYQLISQLDMLQSRMNIEKCLPKQNYEEYQREQRLLHNAKAILREYTITL